jgi:guanine deaminase
LQAFYLATLGGVRALDLEDSIGNFLTGKEADFLILDREATPIIKHRLDVSKNLNEQLFAMMMLGDDRLIKETWIMGEKSHDRDITY